MSTETYRDSEEAKEWLKRTQDSDSSSSEYLNSNLRSQWEDNVRMYNNKHVKGSKYNTELFKKRSQIFRPKTRSAGMKFEAAVSTAFFSTADLVSITAENPTDPEQVASSRILTNLLNYRLGKTIPWSRVLIGAAQEAWKMGICISYQSWVYEEDEKGEIVKDEPVINLVAPENFRIDQSADWSDPIGSTPFIIEYIPMYVTDVKEMVKAGENTKTGEPKWLELEDAELTTARDSFLDSIRTERSATIEDPTSSQKPISDYDMVFVYRNIMNKDGQDWVYYTLAGESMLSKPEKIEDVYPHGRPYVMGSVLVEPFVVYKTGMPELGQGLQEETNYIANDRIDNVHLVLNKRYFAKRGKNVDFRSLLRNIPGSITMMDNPQEDVEVVTTTDITQSSYAEQDRLNVDYDELIGNFSTGSVQSNKSLNETVGGMGMIQSGAGQITEFLIRNFTETWVEKTLRQVVLMEQAYETDEVILAVAASGEKARLMQRFNKDVTIDSLLDKSLTINVNVGISSTNPQMKVERFMFAMTSLGQIMQGPTANMLDIKEVINEVFGHLGYKDGARFFAALNQNEDPRIMKMMQQIQQLTQLVQSKRIEEEAKYRIDREKLEIDIQKLAAENQKTQAQVEKERASAQENMAKARNLEANTQRVLSGADDQIAVRKIDLELQKTSADLEKERMKDKTKRDQILAEWEMGREEMKAKLEITKANRAEPSNNMLDIKKKIDNKDKD